MSPTTWTEQSVAYQGWQDFPRAVGGITGTLLFGSALVGAAGLRAPDTVTWSENSMSATSFTEQTVTATTWTEVSG